ncbi:MAG: acyl-CoA dehydrogenase family protein [bacterium]|nr:acyl-CoA dehydrogenase family protein [bacterium]
MDFAFSEEQELMRRTLHDLLGRVCPPDYAMACDQEGRAPREAFQALAQDGWIGLAIPEEYGGQGRGMTDLAILLEVAGYHYGDLGSWIFRNVSHGGVAILLNGTEEQKRDILPRTASGQAHFAFGLTRGRTPRRSPPAPTGTGAVSGSAERRTSPRAWMSPPTSCS